MIRVIGGVLTVSGVSILLLGFAVVFSGGNPVSFLISLAVGWWLFSFGKGLFSGRSGFLQDLDGPGVLWVLGSASLAIILVSVFVMVFLIHFNWDRFLRIPLGCFFIGVATTIGLFFWYFGWKFAVWRENRR